jgi:hypothetical protein
MPQFTTEELGTVETVGFGGCPAVAALSRHGAHTLPRAAKERAMRLLLGMILGAALTIGGAYVSDTATRSTGSNIDSRPMVNWDVVGKNVDSVSAMIKQAWNKLTGDRA